MAGRHTRTTALESPDKQVAPVDRTRGQTATTDGRLVTAVDDSAAATGGDGR
jgi:hypothetical protein